MSTSSTGTLSVLSSVHGDLNLTFDPTDSDDVKATARVTIERLLKQGFVIMAKMPSGKFRRVTKFDPKKHAYIIKEAGEEQALPVAQTEATGIPQQAGG